MRTYLEQVYGKGRRIYDARQNPAKVDLDNKRTQGIIVFDWMGRIDRFGATGHVDLLHVTDRGPDAKPRFSAACEGSCYWQDEKAPMIAYLRTAQP